MKPAMLHVLVVLMAIACGTGRDDAPTADAVRTAIGVNAGGPTDPRCALPVAPDTLHRDGPAILLAWTFPDAAVYSAAVIPVDSGYLAYRAAIRDDGADLRHPIADQPVPATEAEARMWEDERYNADMAQRGAAGAIEPIRCLDALLFAYQHSRISQIDQPTEFLASVLRREAADGTQLTVLFGAGNEMFPPKAVYGFDRVERLVSDGWQYWYTLHNHTVQHSGDRLALGTPALSTSDVQLMRSLASEPGLESARVTNGFYTYAVGVDELDRLRSR